MFPYTMHSVQVILYVIYKQSFHMLSEVPLVSLIFVETLKLSLPDTSNYSQGAFSMIAGFGNYYEPLAMIQRP